MFGCLTSRRATLVCPTKISERLAADFNAKVKDERDKREHVQKSTIAGWRKDEAQLRNQNDDQSARGEKGKMRQKGQQLEEALYV
jgi:hypothetical protein